MEKDPKQQDLSLVDLVGIRNLLNHLEEQQILTPEERDKVAYRILKDSGFSESETTLLGIGRSWNLNIMKQGIPPKNAEEEPYTLSLPQHNDSYISLTKLALAHSKEAPGYVIQSWMRSGNTLAFLRLWEKENNSGFNDHAYDDLLTRKKAASFSITPKIWIQETKAIGLVSKQGRTGGTYAHPIIACEFASWLTPEFKMLLLKLSLFRDKL